MSHVQSQDGDLTSNAEDHHTGAVEVRSFKLTESVLEGGCREIEIEGELDLAVADRLQQALADGRGDRILIDLASCQFIDSTGIAAILHANRGDKSRVVLHSPRDQVLRVLEVTGLTADGLVFADREQALSALVRPGR